MSRILARSVTADLVARFFNLMLFVLLLPVVVILSRRPGIDRIVPDDSPVPPPRAPKAA